MIAFPLIAPERIAAPTEFFLCEHFHCQLAAGVCIARQRATYLQKSSTATWAGRPRFEYCGSGTCPQGNTIALHLEQPGPRTVSSLIPFRRRAPSVPEHPVDAPPLPIVEPPIVEPVVVDARRPPRRVRRRRRRRTFVDLVVEQLEQRLRAIARRRLQ